MTCCDRGTEQSRKEKIGKGFEFRILEVKSTFRERKKHFLKKSQSIHMIFKPSSVKYMRRIIVDYHKLHRAKK